MIFTNFINELLPHAAPQALSPTAVPTRPGPLGPLLWNRCQQRRDDGGVAGGAAAGGPVGGEGTERLEGAEMC